jgi:serine phosphatase RsbU (regulator of sigma subunit)
MSGPPPRWSQLSTNLAELAGLASSAQRPDQVLHRITVLATRTVPAAASCSVTIETDDQRATAAAANELATQLDELQYSRGDGPCLQALHAGRPVRVDAMAEESRWTDYPRRALDHGVLSSLSLPLALDRPASAAMNLYATVTGGFADDTTQAIAELFAGQAAATLNNAARYRREREIALTLQRSLLPQQLPPLVGLAAAARYLPGTLDTEAGGDFYDLIPLPGTRVGITIGDVMGRGVAAAAVMGQLRAAVRAYALDDHPPARLLAGLDQVVQTLGTGTLTTCTYAVYDPSSRQLTIGTAGHLPPLLAGPRQPTRYLDLDPGLPLGVHEFGSTFQQITLALPTQTTLVLYTDGLVETRNQPLEHGLDRLAAVVHQIQLPPDQVADHILTELGRHTDTDTDDDIALLVLTTSP